ncbi:hypothetical protein CNR22_04230 [Sphingobacteriaceae bacterium]|nr:hypothetical protein CNR22_04230 [Sphingobacteriaceae bacterium]
MKDPTIICVFKLEKFRVGNIPQIKTGEFYKIIFLKNQTQGFASLVFDYPGTPLIHSAGEEGFLCLFSRTFFSKVITDKIDLISYGTKRGTFYSLNEKEDSHVTSIFTKMLQEINSHYTYKHDLLRNYISEITHVVLKSLAENQYH